VARGERLSLNAPVACAIVGMRLQPAAPLEQAGYDEPQTPGDC
jgi:hypothetical protein